MIRGLKYGYYCIVLFCLWLAIPPKSELDNKPMSFVLFDKNDELLGARIARDEQWRFPEMDSIPSKFEQALLHFEDKNFYTHFGVDFGAVARALYHNVKQNKVVSGASTITMQLMRMHNPTSSRTIFQKCKEILKAFRYECHYSKKDILRNYATHAPFGGNIVGLEAASWRYLGKSPFNLSWAESCMLAVLPNAPSLIHLNRNRNRLLEKRNTLLTKLHGVGLIDDIEYRLAKLEPIAPRLNPLPNWAPHFLERVKHSSSEKRFISSLRFDLQSLLSEVVENHNTINQQKGINNLSAIIVNNHSRKIEAYIGNTTGSSHENYNDMVERPRSSGSILKPILYALAIDDGMITPDEIANDTPLSIGGFSPKNYARNYHGAIPYSEVVSKSLNVPSVNLLYDYGINRFLKSLQSLGVTTLNQSAGHYGLPLILGGGDVCLNDLVSVYSGMADVLNTFNAKSAQYEKGDFSPLIFSNSDEKERRELGYQKHQLSAGAIWAMFKAMSRVERPNAEGQWEKFESAKPIHWKTGTSFGNRDAWAIGVTPKYTVGVWVGNSNGDPQHDIIGVSAAGTVLFDIYNFLDIGVPFDIPYDDLREVKICSHSGQIASGECQQYRYDYIPISCTTKHTCQYCMKTFVNSQTGTRVYQDCSDAAVIIDTSYFVLPPLAAFYYRQNHPTYSGLPPLDQACSDLTTRNSTIQFEYPREDVTIYIPHDLSGLKEKCVFKAKHINGNGKIFWHINDQYLGETEELHHLAVDLDAGKHKVTIQDESGSSVSHWVSVVN